MSKLKLASIISVLLVVILLMSSCNIDDILNPSADGTTEQPSQTSPVDDTPSDTGGECTHEFGEWEVVIESTCTQKGKQVRVCSLCMHIENGDIDLKSHTVEILAKVEPTCKAEGKTEGEKCSVCQTVVKAQEPISTIAHNYDKGICTMCGAEEPDCNHSFGEWSTVKNATCTEKGLKERSCSICGVKDQDDIETLAHTEVIDKAVAATCTEPGLTEGKHCSACKKALIAQETVKANGHKYTEGVCHCGAKDPNYVPAKKYTVIFKDYDGTVISTQSIKEGTAATAPKNPTRDGYDFTGWDKSFNNVTSDITITAIYEIISTEPQFVVSSKDAKRGDTIEVTVALKNNPGIASIILSVAFDSDALTLTEVVYNTAIGGQTVQPQNMNSPVKLYWINGFSDAEGDFVLATLNFTVKSDAAVGDHNITLSYNADDVYDISETNLPFEIVNGKITVKQ